jgi:transcriptional regulator with XRE-family HTH domain
MNDSNLLDLNDLTLNDLIRFERLKLGLTQEYMAHSLGISQNYYHKMECGKCDMKVKTLICICKTLNISIKILVKYQNLNLTVGL